LIPSRSPVIEIQTSFCETAYNERGIRLVVMNTFGDEIEFFSCGTLTVLDGDWDQVLSEISGCRVDEEALSA
jgi:hypothetical protein